MLVRDIHQDATGANSQLPLAAETDADTLFAQRVRLFRERAGMTQRALADHMTASGYKMHQTTIAKIEAFERPVYVGEAVALAALLRVQLQEFTAPPVTNADLAERARLISEAQREVNLAQRDVAKHDEEIEQAQVLRERAERRYTEAQERVSRLIHGTKDNQ